MKKLIFCLVVLLASAGFANAQLDGSYPGTATDLVMGGPVSGTYICTTTFSNNAMTVLAITVAGGHSVAIDPNNKPTFSGSGTSYVWNDDGVGTVSTPYGTYDFEVTGITVWFVGGKLTYYFEAYVDDLSMTISFTFTAN